MTDDFRNVYDDGTRAASYDALEFPGTYYLAYRDIPAIVQTHVRGSQALDFGCGTGRSTRFLKGLGFETIGVDISAPMLERARERDPEGDYRQVGDGELSALEQRRFDLALAAFTFDNIPTFEQKVASLSAIRTRLGTEGLLLVLVSTPEIYLHEWASFSTAPFPENREARSGDRVYTIMLDVPDRRPVEDVMWSDPHYREVFAASGLEVEAHYRPLGRADEPYAWVSETSIPPWSIYVLRAGSHPTQE